MRALLLLLLFVTTAQAQYSTSVPVDGNGQIMSPCPVREWQSDRDSKTGEYTVDIYCSDNRKYHWRFFGQPKLDRLAAEAEVFRRSQLNNPQPPRKPDTFNNPYPQQPRFWSDMGAIFFFFVVIPGVIVAGFMLFGKFVSELPEKTQKAVYDENNMRKLQSIQAIEAARVADLRTVPTYPSLEQFKTDIQKHYEAQTDRVLVPQYVSQLLDTAGKIYTESFIPPKQLPSLQDPYGPYDALVSCFVRGLVAFTKLVPHVTQEKDYVFPPNALFTEEQPTIDIEALAALATPFVQARTGSLQDSFKWHLFHYICEDPPPSLETSWDEKEQKRLQREYEKKLKEYNKYREKMAELVTDEQWKLHHTPYYFANLTPQFTLKKAFPISDTPRFEGMWMVAPSGSGKTNALLKLITDDFDRVAKGEASVVVMDSSGMAPGRLLHFLSRHKDFAPGGRLENRLVVLDPSFDYPLALNLFDVDIEHINTLSNDQRAASLGAARDMIRFVLGSLLGSELTQKQGGLFRYLTEAMMFIPNATVFTLAELLEDQGYEKHRQHILKLDDWAVKFFENRFRQQYNYTRPVKNAFAATKSEVFWRIDAMLSDQLFRGMFSHAKNKLDMFKEMQSGKVILINTNRELLREDGMETFGRFMLAFIYRAAEKRLSYARKENIPVFVYIDECHDYIANEPRVVKLLDQLARKNNIGFAFAHQRPNNIKSAEVLDALSSTAIRFASRNEHGVSYVAERLRVDPPELITQLDRGVFASLVRDSKGTRTGFVTFPPMEDKIPLMSEKQYAIIQNQMRAEYSRPPEATPELAAPPDAEPEPETVDGDEGDWFDGPKT